MQNYIISPAGFNTVINNTAYNIPKSDSRYASIIKVLSELPKAEQEQAVLEIIKGNVKKDNAISKGFVITDDSVTYEGQPLPAVLQQKVRRIYEQGLPLDLFVNFWKNLSQNPSQTSVNELYDFLAYKELPITEDGFFLAYKGIDTEYWSIHGNKQTIVLSGVVDEQGRIFNGIGEKIEVLRRNVNDDRTVHCSTGLHCGSLNYAKGFGQRTVIVKVNPKDVVSVPSDYDCQKLRCCAYEVVADFVEEIVAPVVDSDIKPIQNIDNQERNKYVQRIEQYLLNKRSSVNTVTFRQIQSIFSPEWPSKIQIQEALQQLEYSWSGEDVNTYKLGDHRTNKPDDWYDDDYNQYEDEDEDWYDDDYNQYEDDGYDRYDGCGDDE